MATIHSYTSDISNHSLATSALTPVVEETPSGHCDASEDKNEIGSLDGTTASPVRNGHVQSDAGIEEDDDEAKIRSNSAPMKHSNTAIHTSISQGARRQTTESSGQIERAEIRKLTASQIEELIGNPDSLPSRTAFQALELAETPRLSGSQSNGRISRQHSSQNLANSPTLDASDERSPHDSATPLPNLQTKHTPASLPLSRRPSEDRNLRSFSRPNLPRAISTPHSTGARQSTVENHRIFGKYGLPNSFDETPPSRKVEVSTNHHAIPSPPESPIEDLPLPPFSLPTYLHLEISSGRPSPLYIHRPPSSDIPYEPSRVKFERLLNFLLLPPQLERVLFFGALTCLDAWLYTFTILPLRFIKALWILMRWVVSSIWSEVQYLGNFIYSGLGRLWIRRKRRQSMRVDGAVPGLSRRPSIADVNVVDVDMNSRASFGQSNGAARPPRGKRINSFRQHRRTRSVPSLLQTNHKADLLQGLLIIISCTILMRFDASKMYHGIRGQAAIKLYVIYNVLEVCDRLFSALGQDIIECLFSPETLERKPNGRSKIIAPLWMFLLALSYTVFHAAAFFYQVITLNVAVNSYSNALLTLLLSNQFVEIKGTVFKKFEKENLFQLTCADVVERFQLWLMLLIIALRNIVELGGLSLGASADFSTPASSSPTGSPPPNTTLASNLPGPLSILPNSFTLLPSPAQLQLLTPFLLVLGSEMLVDWLKHAYITKFNATTPKVYARYYDVLARDYYSNAFGSQNLVKRLGLPVIPLSCLFIRAMLQTYHMFLATNVPAPVSLASKSSSIVSLALGDEASPSASPALAQIDAIFRNALGRSSFGGGTAASTPFLSWSWWSSWTLDDGIALTTMLVFFAAVWLLLLAFKLLLGMCLLSVARDRCKSMQGREADMKVVEKESKRLGGWGTVEVGEERRKLIYEGDEKGLKGLREKEVKAMEKERDKGRDRGRGKGDGLDAVDRYSMVAKRIW